MIFRDDYEYEVGGQTYYIEVEGTQVIEDDELFTEVNAISITDEAGNILDEEHEHYSEIFRDAQEREYEVEEHNTNFDYYDYGA